MAIAEKNWFSGWFDTPYYHILYSKRGDQEAQLFMKNLTRFLDLPQGARILDLACGRGRHSVYLNRLGYDVTGVDLSRNNISYARQFENPTLHFEEHCMGKPLGKTFDAVFNLFTSLGYFEDEKDNVRTVQAIKENLRPGGYGVIDFMNVHKVIRNLVPQEVKTVQGIDFKITRSVDNGFIQKHIRFEDKGQEHCFTEKVRALTLNGFRRYFEHADIEIQSLFGNYDLEPFDERTSDRLILVFN